MALPADDRSQPLVGYRTNEEWQNLLAEIAALIDQLEKVEDPALRDKIFGALQAIDALHREALHRLVNLFKEGVLEQVVTDPAIRTLMEMYDLLPSARADGKTWDFLTPEEVAAGPSMAAGTARKGRAPYPHWSPARLDRKLADAKAAIVETDDGLVLVAKAGGVLYALAASCPTHGAPMHAGTLEHFSWICPLGAGCIYDVRNGARLGGGPHLKAYPVRQAENGDLLIGFGIPYDPKLPAF